MAPGVYQAGAARREKISFRRIEGKNTQKLLAVLEENPFQPLPPFESCSVIWQARIPAGSISSTDSCIRS
jgi:hypothetical protein